MATLHEIYASYVPALIARRAAADPAHFERSTAEVFEAAVLFADISGFTALTERLAVRGAAGAEDLTRLLNAYLGQLVATVIERGGDIVKFAGDAVLVLWPVKEPETLSAAVARAASCALEIQRTLHDYPVADDVRLSLKLAIGAGSVVFATLGGVRSRWEHLVTGPPLPQVGIANIQAQPGQTILSPEAWAELENAKGEPLRDGYMLLESLESDPPPVAAPPVEMPEESASVLRAFIPAAIRARLDAGQSDWLAELRRLTILFVNLPDISYHTQLADAQSAMTSLQECLYRYEGSINKLSVDDKGASLIAVLGLPPLAHEDDAVRGIRAALDMRATLEAKGLSCSTGVTTGLAFCGSVGGERRREYTIMGDVVNLAARLMQAAAGGILCDEATVDATGGRMSFQPLASMKVKGKKDPVSVFRPEASETAAPVVSSVASDDGEIVGRDDERARLAARVEALVDAKKGGRVLVEGEAGMGKSRIVAEAADAARRRGARVLVGASDSIESSTPYYAWRAIFSELLGIADLPAEANERQHHVLSRLPLDPEARRAAPLLEAVLPFDWPDNDYTAGLAGKARADATHDLLAKLLEKAAAADPLVLVVEDAHWLDTGSWALLHVVAERVRPLLLLVASRPHAAPAPPDYTRLAQEGETIRLERLAPDAAVAIARSKLGVTSLPAPVEIMIGERSDGNPFFAEELAYAMRDAGMFVVENGEARMAPASVKTFSLEFPRTIQGLITSRIDRLSPEEQLTIKVASVIGRAFSVRALGEIHPVAPSRDQLLEHVERLHILDLTPVERPAPDLQYVFKHVITHDVAYGLMPYEQRRALHRAVAEWYERVYAADLEPLFPYLAYHWRKAAEDRTPDAELLAKSIDYYERAANRAVRAYVNQEAIDFYTSALRLAGDLPESADRDALELRIRLALGATLIATRGYGSDEVRETYDRARELCERVGDDELLFTALRGLWAFAIGRADFRAARDLGDRMLGIAEKDGAPDRLLEAHRALGNTVFWLGDLEAAREHMERGIELYAPDRDRELAFRYAQDPDVANRGMQTWPLSLEGRVAEARTRGDEALAHARDLGHPYSVGYALVHDMCSRQYLRDVDGVEKRSAEAVTLASEKGFPNWLLAGMALGGWAAAKSGEPAEGASRIRDAIDLWRSSGSELVVPYFCALLAEAYLDGGRIDEGLEAIGSALEIAARNEDRWYEPEMRRIEGDLARAKGDADGAERSYRAAIDLAREQGALLFELRAANALARLQAGTDGESDAREAVATLYGRFDESLDLPDLADARAVTGRDATA
jgi:class 3 adenylate cyclase/predicted ATPase